MKSVFPNIRPEARRAGGLGEELRGCYQKRWILGGWDKNCFL
jgi:hypothetical protein